MKGKIIILGAGVSGLAAAIKCKMLGYHVTLIEKGRIGAHLGGGIDIHPNGVKVLFSLGIENALRELTQSQPREIIIGNAKGNEINRVPLEIFEKNSRYPLMSFLRQDLLKALFDHAEIDEVYENTQCESVFIKDDGVEVLFKGKAQRVCGDILIGADGIHSITRQALHPQIHKRYLGHISIGGLVSRELFRYNYIHGLRRTCVVFPCTDKFCHTVMFRPFPEGHLRTQCSSFEERSALLRGWSEEVDGLLDHLNEHNRFAVESYEIPPLEFYAKKSIFLIGDAAHAMSPLGALATSLALEDVEDLYTCLSMAPSVDDATRFYNRLAIPRARSYRDFSLQFLVATMNTHESEDYLRRMVRMQKAKPDEVFSSLTALTQGALDEKEVFRKNQRTNATREEIAWEL